MQKNVTIRHKYVPTQHKDDVTGNTSKMYNHTNLCGNNTIFNVKIPTQIMSEATQAKCFTTLICVATTQIKMSKIQHKNDVIVNTSQVFHHTNLC